MPDNATDAQWPSRLATFRADPYALSMGFRLVSADVGHAAVEVTLQPSHLNFAGVPHGGLMFSLADYAFAVASNSHGRVAVATNVSIQFLAAASVGATLTAQAREIQLTHRVGFYEMVVTSSTGQEVARCLGTVQRSQRSLDEQSPPGGHRV